MSFRFPPFELTPSEEAYRLAAYEFFQPRLYDECVAKGRKIFDELTSLDPPVKISTTNNLTSWYYVERTSRQIVADSAVNNALSQWGISGGDFESVSVTSGPDVDAAYRNWFNVRGGCLCNFSNFKRQDTNDDARRLWPSDVIWQSWLLAGDKFPNFDPSSLRLIMRTCVINLSARRAIWYATRRSTCLTGDISSGYAEYTPLDEGFYAILGSTNGASSVRLLQENKYELCGRTIDKVVVVGGPPGRGCEKRGPLDIRDDFERPRSFFLVLSERRGQGEYVGAG